MTTASRRKPELQPRKQPLQARSQAMVATILEAAARVLAKESLAGLNTNRVAEVAGISVGSLYQYFPNKAALVAALIAQAQAELAEAVQATVEATKTNTLREALAALVDLAIKHQFARPLLAAALDHEERRLPVQDVLLDAQARIAADVACLLQRHRAELPGAPPPHAAQDCVVIAKAMVEADMWAARSPPPDLAQRVLQAMLGYLKEACTASRPRRHNAT